MGGRGVYSSTAKDAVNPSSAGTVSEAEAKEMREAIESYTGSEYGPIRKASLGDSDYAEFAPEAAAIESYLSGKSFDGTMFRGIVVEKAVADSFTVGAVIDQKGISSWSKSERVAKGFTMKYSGKQESVVFRMSGGTRRGCDISQISTHQSEQEVLVSVESKQIVTARKKIGNIIYIDVKEV